MTKRLEGGEAEATAALSKSAPAFRTLVNMLRLSSLESKILSGSEKLVEGGM